MAVTNYAPWQMPKLSEALDAIRAEPGAWRVRISRGTPMYYYHNRYLKHVHANIRYKDGIETFRSRSLTDGLMASPVARIATDEQHRSAKIQVFIPYGRMKRREPKPPPADTVPVSPTEYIRIPDDIEEELPFN